VLLAFIIFVVALFILRTKKEILSESKTNSIPIFSGSIIGFILGAAIGLISSKYLLPTSWWYQSDLPRNFELGFLGSLLGTIVGALVAVLIYGEKKKAAERGKFCITNRWRNRRAKTACVSAQPLSAYVTERN